MAVTVKGFQGTVSDADMATQFPTVPGVVATPTDLVVSAVNGARQVSVSAGSAIAHFVKYTSDAAQTLTLTPPSSGGKWFAIALDREWSPTNTATLVAVDTGVTTDGSSQVSIAACLTQGGAAPTAPTWLKQNPGTAGSTAAFGHHQVLAFVHVRAADTTLQVVGVRTIGGGVGLPFVESIHALAWHAQTSGGGRANRIAVGPHAYGSDSVQCIEAVGNGFGAFLLTGRVFTGAGSSLAGLGQAIRTQLLAYQPIGRVFGETCTEGRAGLYFQDISTPNLNIPAGYTWNGSNWELFDASIIIGQGVNGGTTLPSATQYWDYDVDAGLSVEATRHGRLVTIRLNLKTVQTVNRGGNVAQLPDGFKCKGIHTFEVGLYGYNNSGWDGATAHFTVDPNGQVNFQGVTGGNGNATIPPNIGIFLNTTFRAKL